LFVLCSHSALTFCPVARLPPLVQRIISGRLALICQKSARLALLWSSHLAAPARTILGLPLLSRGFPFTKMCCLCTFHPPSPTAWHLRRPSTGTPIYSYAPVNPTRAFFLGFFVTMLEIHCGQRSHSNVHYTQACTCTARRSCPCTRTHTHALQHAHW